jgi:cytochrome bd ubiquinol oxidase subunit II
VAGGVALTGVFVLRADGGRLFDHLLGDGLPLLVVSGAAGLSAVVLIARGSLRGVRLLATAAVAAVVAGWGVAQYPYLLGTHVRIAEAVAPPATLAGIVAVFVAAAVLVGPSLGLLFWLQQQGRLETH